MLRSLKYRLGCAIPFSLAQKKTTYSNGNHTSLAGPLRISIFTPCRLILNMLLISFTINPVAHQHSPPFLYCKAFMLRTSYM